MLPDMRICSARKWALSCLGLCCLLFSGSSIADTPLEYAVKVPADLSMLTVTTCFKNDPPQRLVSENRNAQHLIRNIRLIHGGQSMPLALSGSVIDLEDAQQGDCLRYEATLYDRTARAWFGTRLSHHAQVLVGLQDWLWVPAWFDDSGHIIQLNFILPNGMQVSSPGHRTVHDGGVSYRLLKRPPDWEASIALGRFTEQSLPIAGATVNIAILNAAGSMNTSGLLEWIRKNLEALSKAYGTLPVQDLQVLVVPVGQGREPVPWGQLMRGGGDAVHLYIDQTRPERQFMNDWVLIHELSHLFHPWIYARDRWLYEGIATYYQNVLRAREGLISPDAAWTELHQGFERGLKGTPENETLVEVSENMLRNRRFMRVYWSGAAFCLKADYELRKQSHDRQSLDTALKKFDECCLPATGLWTGREFLDKLDELTHTTVFRDLYDKYAMSTTFPKLDDVYRSLGLIKHGDAITMDNQATDASICKAIMQKR